MSRPRATLIWVSKQVAGCPRKGVHHTSSGVDLSQGCRRELSRCLTTAVLWVPSVEGGCYLESTCSLDLLYVLDSFTELEVLLIMVVPLLEIQRFKEKKPTWRRPAWGKRMALFVHGGKPRFYKNKCQPTFPSNYNLSKRGIVVPGWLLFFRVPEGSALEVPRGAGRHRTYSRPRRTRALILISTNSQHGLVRGVIHSVVRKCFVTSVDFLWPVCTCLCHKLASFFRNGDSYLQTYWPPWVLTFSLPRMSPWTLTPWWSTVPTSCRFSALAR